MLSTSTTLSVLHNVTAAKDLAGQPEEEPSSHTVAEETGKYLLSNVKHTLRIHSVSDGVPLQRSSCLAVKNHYVNV